MSDREERVKTLLRQGMVCALRDFYGTRRPNDRNAISELWDKGFQIRSETRGWHCTDDPNEPPHAHHWLIRDPERVPVQLALVG